MLKLVFSSPATMPELQYTVPSKIYDHWIFQLRDQLFLEVELLCCKLQVVIKHSNFGHM